MIFLLVIVCAAFCNQNVYYVSQAKGNDSDSHGIPSKCTKQSEPCKTFGRVREIIAPLDLKINSSTSYKINVLDSYTVSTNEKFHLNNSLLIECTSVGLKFVGEGKLVMNILKGAGWLNYFDINDQSSGGYPIIVIPLHGGIRGGSIILNMSTITVPEIDNTSSISFYGNVENAITCNVYRTISFASFVDPSTTAGLFGGTGVITFSGCTFLEFNKFVAAGKNFLFDSCTFQVTSFDFNNVKATFDAGSSAGNTDIDGYFMRLANGADVTIENNFDIGDSQAKTIFKLDSSSFIRLIDVKLHDNTVATSFFDIGEKCVLNMTNCVFQTTKGPLMFDFLDPKAVISNNCKYEDCEEIDSFLKCTAAVSVNFDFTGSSISPYINTSPTCTNCTIKGEYCSAFFDEHKKKKDEPEHKKDKKDEIKWWYWGIPVIVVCACVICCCCVLLVLICLALLVVVILVIGGALGGGGFGLFAAFKGKRDPYDNLDE